MRVNEGHVFVVLQDIKHYNDLKMAYLLCKLVSDFRSHSAP